MREGESDPSTIRKQICRGFLRCCLTLPCWCPFFLFPVFSVCCLTLCLAWDKYNDEVTGLDCKERNLLTGLEVHCCFVTFSIKLATYLRNKKLVELHPPMMIDLLCVWKTDIPVPPWHNVPKTRWPRSWQREPRKLVVDMAWRIVASWLGILHFSRRLRLSCSVHCGVTSCVPGALLQNSLVLARRPGCGHSL